MSSSVVIAAWPTRLPKSWLGVFFQDPHRNIPGHNLSESFRVLIDFRNPPPESSRIFIQKKPESSRFHVDLPESPS